MKNYAGWEVELQENSRQQRYLSTMRKHCIGLVFIAQLSGCSIVHLPPSKTMKNNSSIKNPLPKNEIPARYEKPAEPAQLPTTNGTPPLIRNLFFITDSVELTVESQVLFSSIIEELNGYQFTQIKVIGHADTVASQPYNHTLSNLRAEHITQELISHGVTPSLILTEGRGEGDLFVPTEDNVDDVRNRRVTIELR